MKRLWLALREDAEFACRSLARVPTYATTLLLTLALAIGGVSAVFSVLYAVVLRPLPFPGAREIVMLHTHFNNLGLSHVQSSPSEFLDVQQQNQSFSRGAAIQAGSFNLTGVHLEGQGEAVHVEGARVSADFFRLFGLVPVLGRDFAPREDQPGAPAVVLLSERFHRRAFGGAADAVGRSIDIDGTPHTIIGVLPGAYDRPRLGEVTGKDGAAPDLWIPFQFEERQLAPAARGNRSIQVFARLRPDVSFAGASADIARITESFYQRFPDGYRRESGFRLFLEPLQDYDGGELGRVLWLLIGAVALVLLAACANAASLSLARLTARRREIAVRSALGASAGRIALTFLVESLIVALAAGVLGVVLGRAAMDGLLALGSAQLSNVEVAFQWPVFAFALGVSGVAGVIAGAAPAWHAARLAPTSGLREGGRSTNAGALRLRSGLVVAQVTVALVLLVGAAMILRSVVRLTTASPGFEPRDVYVGQVSLAEPRYQEGTERRRFADALLARLRATPGVESVGLIAPLLPFGADWSAYKLQIEGDPIAPISSQAQVRMVGGDYFDTLGFELVAGRFLGAGDSSDAPRVAVISERTAKKYFNGRNPLGMRLVYRGGAPSSFTIVGIVADTLEMGMDQPIEPFVFVPFEQWTQASLGVALRAPKLGASALAALAAAVAAVDPAQPLYRAQPLQQLVDASLGSRRFTLLLLSVFAALGLLLAVLGIYGLTSYSVAQRTQELAVRMAMGADDVAIVRLVLSQAVALVAIGLLFGALLSVIAGRYLAARLYGLSAWDPEAAALIAALLVSAAVAAGWGPARRAARLPLAGALRAE